MKAVICFKIQVTGNVEQFAFVFIGGQVFVNKLVNASFVAGLYQ